ncbi:MAG: glycosyltransferase family 4 protein, partial [Gaiellaceae bacterium]
IFGGAEAYLARIVEGLRDEFDFTALVPDGADEQTLARLADAGASIEPVPGLARLPTRRGLTGLVKSFGRLHPGVVHVNLTDQRDGASALFAARLRRLPSVATLNLVVPAHDRLKERVSRTVLRRADALIAVSGAVGEYASRLGIEPRVVRHGLPVPAESNDVRAKLGLAAEQVVVGGVGRLDHQKGWDLLCAAAARVHDTRPDVRFMVIGDGPERENLGRDPQSHHVEFVGARDDAASLMAAFDVLAIPSRYEAFGLVAVEAMLSGVPVVAAAAGGLIEVVNGAGRLVPTEDPVALASSLLELVEDEDGRRSMAAQAARRARERFELTRMLDETRAIYDELYRGARA